MNVKNVWNKDFIIIFLKLKILFINTMIKYFKLLDSILDYLQDIYIIDKIDELEIHMNHCRRHKATVFFTGKEINLRKRVYIKISYLEKRFKIETIKTIPKNTILIVYDNLEALPKFSNKTLDYDTTRLKKATNELSHVLGTTVGIGGELMNPSEVSISKLSKPKKSDMFTPPTKKISVDKELIFKVARKRFECGEVDLERNWRTIPIVTFIIDTSVEQKLDVPPEWYKLLEILIKNQAPVEEEQSNVPPGGLGTATVSTNAPKLD